MGMIMEPDEEKEMFWPFTQKEILDALWPGKIIKTVW